MRARRAWLVGKPSLTQGGLQSPQRGVPPPGAVPAGGSLPARHIALLGDCCNRSEVLAPWLQRSWPSAAPPLFPAPFAPARPLRAVASRQLAQARVIISEVGRCLVWLPATRRVVRGAAVITRASLLA